MSLFSRLLQAVRSWGRRRGGPKTAKRYGVAMEQLDHRQLLSVNFTGNVATDFPATRVPGVVILPDNPSVLHPVIAPAIAPIVKVSGFDVSGIRVTYTSNDDTLNIGIEQPQSQQLGQPGPVIAGDADNNGNSATVNPAVTGTPGFGSFKDFPDFGGTEFMGAFLDLRGTGYADVVAGFSGTDPRPTKEYQVATAVVNTSAPPTIPLFGAELPQFEGNVYYNNSPNHPNFEFAIKDFSQLYQSVTGQPLTPQSVINIGAFGGSADDIGISEAFFPQQSFVLSQATTTDCPPVSPPILVNPHEHRIIDTLHQDLVRVHVLGTSGFDVTQINPSSVALDGAAPIAHFNRHVDRDEFLDATYVFNAKDLNLPTGLQDVTLTGRLLDGQVFSSSRQVLNIPNAMHQRGQLGFLMNKGNQYPALNRLLDSQGQPPALSVDYTPRVSSQSVKVAGASSTSAQGLKVQYKPQTGLSTKAAASFNSGAVVSLKQAQSGTVGQNSRPNVPRALRSSMSRYLKSAGLTTPGASVGTQASGLSAV